MSDEGRDNLMLRYLRGIDAKVDRLVEDLREMKQRIIAVGDGLLGVRRESLNVYETRVCVQHTLDRHGERLDRIERRLELLPA